MTNKILIATPMYGGLCYGEYAASCLELTNLFGSHGIWNKFEYLYNESLITRARNLLAYQFLQTDFTHLLFIDADIKFDALDTLNLIAADKDIICGLYPKKGIDWVNVEKAVKKDTKVENLKYYGASIVANEIEKTDNNIVEIEYAGTGFMMIKRNVFEALSPHCNKYFHNSPNYDFNQRNPKEQALITEYFATSIDDKTQTLLSEDYHFCKLAKKHGFKVWADLSIKLTHIGTYHFESRPDLIIK